MHLEKPIPCEVCGKPAAVVVTPDAHDAQPASYTYTRTCSGECPPATRSLAPHDAQELTGHTYDGATGRWTRLISTSVEGWIP
ncbi:MAG: hypothetical protein R2745_05040 [Vicinamibacterales bacterium]